MEHQIPLISNLIIFVKHLNTKVFFCQKWDSNPRLQGRLRPEPDSVCLHVSMTCLSVSGLGETAHHQPADVKDRETEGALIPRVGLWRLHDAFQPEHPEENAAARKNHRLDWKKVNQRERETLRHFGIIVCYLSWQSTCNSYWHGFILDSSIFIHTHKQKLSVG